MAQMHTEREGSFTEFHKKRGFTESGGSERSTSHCRKEMETRLHPTRLPVFLKEWKVIEFKARGDYQIF